MKQMIVPKYAQTLWEASLVDVIVVFYWIPMELLVMVCKKACTCKSTCEKEMSYVLI